MANRYIDRNKFLKKCAEAWGYAGVTIKAIEGIADECITADVVPRETVEQIFEEIMHSIERRVWVVEELAEDSENEDYYMGRADAYCRIGGYITELKKKYTERSEGEG